METMLRIAPPVPWAPICLAAAMAAKSGERTFSAYMASKASGEVSARGPKSPGDVDAPAGVVDQHVQRAHGLDALADHGVRRQHIAQVGGQDVRLPSEGPDLLRHLLQLVAAAGGQRHVGALARERERDGAADATAGAGDECLLAFVGEHRRDASLRWWSGWGRSSSAAASWVPRSPTT